MLRRLADRDTILLVVEMRTGRLMARSFWPILLSSSFMNACCNVFKMILALRVTFKAQEYPTYMQNQYVHRMHHTVSGQAQDTYKVGESDASTQAQHPVIHHCYEGVPVGFVALHRVHPVDRCLAVVLARHLEGACCSLASVSDPYIPCTEHTGRF